MAFVAAAASALPPPVAQDDVARLTARLVPSVDAEKLEAIFRNTGIVRRHLAEPLEWYAHRHDLAERQRSAAEAALRLAEDAAVAALARAGVRVEQVDALVLVTSTVWRAPNIDAALVERLGLRPDVRRVPLVGFASLGGAAGVALGADLVRAGLPNVLVVAVEANSIAFVPGDAPLETAVSMALFSDGASAVVVRDQPGGPHLLAHRSTLVPSSEAVMGFEVTDDGLRWRLAPDVPDVAMASAGASVADALASVGWALADLDHLLVHPGGAKVLDAVAAALALPPDALWWSNEAMRDHGNVSSVTVLLVLERFLAAGPPEGRGLLTAMGPGFGYEHVLFEVVASR